MQVERVIKIESAGEFAQVWFVVSRDDRFEDNLIVSITCQILTLRIEAKNRLIRRFQRIYK